MPSYARRSWITDMLAELKGGNRSRLERAADEVPGLEKHLRRDAIEPYLMPEGMDRHRLRLAVMDPRRFEDYAVPIDNVFGKHEYNDISGPSGRERSHKETIEKLMRSVNAGRGFVEMPYLGFSEKTTSGPPLPGVVGGISFHQGRHRMRALGELGYDRSLVGIQRDLEAIGPPHRWSTLPKRMSDLVLPQEGDNAVDPVGWNSGFKTLPFRRGGLAMCGLCPS